MPLNIKNKFIVKQSVRVNPIPPVPPPVAWYKGDGNGNDSSGNGNNAYTLGRSTFSPGKIGQAFSFGLSGNGVSIASNSMNNIGGNKLSLSAWVNWNGYTGNTDINCVMRKCYLGGYNASPRRSYSIDMGKSNGSITFDINEVGTVTAPAGTASPNTWVHVAATYDGSKMCIYINGVLSNTTVTTGTIPQYTGPLTIGGASEFGNNNAMKGLVDEVKIWNIALTPANVLALYNQLT